ncbi:FMN-binding protein [Microbacterium deminutum]|uniref:FMN-binding domain-containing protein n=1 Tax=Microbacterium deminutum TaxID=344164 RepID=A0ABN2RC24_9MICO
MKKIIYAIIATIGGLILLFSYRTSLGESVVESTSANTTSATSSPSSGSVSSGSVSSGSSGSSVSSGSSGSSGSSSGTAGGGSAGGATTSGLTDGSYTGQAADTRFGPVQVQITVAGGRIADVTVPEYPSGNGRDQQINARALPQLVSETLTAQSASVDMVTGATYTSQGYLQSLQSAIDQASS